MPNGNGNQNGITPAKTINTRGPASQQTIQNWFRNPLPPYTPLADVAFADTAQPIIPLGPPMGPMVFPNAVDNKMLNIPGIQSIYEMRRTGGTF
jgi:hypothetical protein